MEFPTEELAQKFVERMSDDFGVACLHDGTRVRVVIPDESEKAYVVTVANRLGGWLEDDV